MVQNTLDQTFTLGQSLCACQRLTKWSALSPLQFRYMSQHQATHGILNWPSDDTCLVWGPTRRSRARGDEMWQMLPVMWGLGPCAPSPCVQPNCHKWDAGSWVVTFPAYRSLKSGSSDICCIVSPYYLNGRQRAWWQHVIYVVYTLRQICDLALYPASNGLISPVTFVWLHNVDDFVN